MPHAPKPIVVWVLALAALTGCAATKRTAAECRCRSVASPTRSAEVGDPGFVVMAPDRGFLGNEEVRDAFAAFAGGRNAALVFVTDDGGTRADLDAALRALAEAGARRAIVLPLFLSRFDGRFEQARTVAEGTHGPIPVSVARSFGDSYLAVEVLADRFRAIPEPRGRPVVVVGEAAGGGTSQRHATADLRRLADLAAQGFGFASVDVVTWPHTPRGWQDGDAGTTLAAAVGAGRRAAVVPYELGWKFDSHMSLTSALSARLRGTAQVVEDDVTPHPAIAMWMAREANRYVPLRADEVGVVLLAHGADHRWNERLREAAGSVAERYKLEFAFSMADQPIVERAIRRLEARGARGIVILRVFGLASSFRAVVERMIGFDVEGRRSSENPVSHAAHGPGHGHRGGHTAPPPRIRSAALMTTVGGLEDSPYFADALLDRALGLSEDPARETIILVAHGAEEDAANDHWRAMLAAIASRMRAGAGAKFRAIRTGTWREDWPDERAPEIAAIRRLVEEASRDGGHAIVIPARVTGVGPEREFLAGLGVKLGDGFVPHPLFERWLEQEIGAGIALLRAADAPGIR